MGFQVEKVSDVLVVDVEGQLIVGNRQELKQKVFEHRDELEARGTQLVFARARQDLARFFRPTWVSAHERGNRMFPTIKSAIEAFEKREPTTHPSA